MIKAVDCLKFEYQCTTYTKRLMVESELQFTAQTPRDSSLLERAILVHFQVKGEEGKFKLNCVCRVIFSFEKEEELLEGKKLLQAHQKEAYEKMKEKVQSVLKVFEQNEKIFPEYDFE